MRARSTRTENIPGRMMLLAAWSAILYNKVYLPPSIRAAALRIAAAVCPSVCPTLWAHKFRKEEGRIEASNTTQIFPVERETDSSIFGQKGQMSKSGRPTDISNFRRVFVAGLARIVGAVGCHVSWSPCPPRIIVVIELLNRLRVVELPTEIRLLLRSTVDLQGCQCLAA